MRTGQWDRVKMEKNKQSTQTKRLSDQAVKKEAKFMNVMDKCNYVILDNIDCQNIISVSTV